MRLQVQCSRRLSDAEIAERQAWWLQQARSGAVLVSPCISKGEKLVMRTAFEEGLPLIVLQENGFTDLAKPGGRRMEACSRDIGREPPSAVPYPLFSTPQPTLTWSPLRRRRHSRGNTAQFVYSSSGSQPPDLSGSIGEW